MKKIFRCVMKMFKISRNEHIKFSMSYFMSISEKQSSYKTTIIWFWFVFFHLWRGVGEEFEEYI